MSKSPGQALEALRLAVVKERQGERDLTLAAEAARQAANAAQEELIEAHAAADAKRIRAAERARATAEAKADTAAIQAEAARRRADRAKAEQEAYTAANAKALVAELEPDAAAIVKRIEAAAAALVEADQAWGATRQRAADLLAAAPHRDGNLPESHALHSLATELRKALQRGAEVASPLSHYGAEGETEAEQARVVALRGQETAA